MMGILGTEIRTKCACDGTGADFRELYECYGVHRVLWVNPCVVEAQKDYHRLRGNFRTTPSFGGGRSQPDFPTSYTPPYSPGRPGGGRSQTPDKTRWPTYPTPPSRWTHTPMVTTTRRTWPTPPWGSRGEGGAGRPTWYRTTPRRKTQPTTTPIPTTPTTPTLPPKYCLLERPGQPVRYIREGYKKRLYKHDDPDCSELCECNLNEKLSCQVLSCIERVACNTGVAFYSHESPYFQAHRGKCLCYSGSFICSKPPKEDPANVQQGVYLFLGYSEKDESLLKKVTNQGAIDALGAIQGLVSYHNVNANKSECRILMLKQSPENLVLQAVMDEFEENREKGNLTAELLNREKMECLAALETISNKINGKDADMRQHVVLSMFKVAAAEADVPPLPSSAAAVAFGFNGEPSTGVLSGACGHAVGQTLAMLVFNSLIILVRNCQLQVAL